MKPRLIVVSLAVLASHCSMVTQAFAAGGHHAVDDAATLEPGQCQLESWSDRERGGGRTLLHIGTACRVGAVELGLNLDGSRSAGADLTLAGPQLKWAHPLTPSLSVGVVLSAGWQNRGPGFAGSSIVFPLTWQVSETLLFHVNLGRDFRRQGPDFTRAGSALEWSAWPRWSLIVERFREIGLDAARLGTRYAPNPNVSIDLSQARGLGGEVPSWWTFGVNWQFGQSSTRPVRLTD